MVMPNLSGEFGSLLVEYWELVRQGGLEASLGVGLKVVAVRSCWYLDWLFAPRRKSGVLRASCEGESWGEGLGLISASGGSRGVTSCNVSGALHKRVESLSHE